MNDQINKMTVGLLIALFLSMLMIGYVIHSFRVDDVSLKKGGLEEFDDIWKEDIVHLQKEFNVTMVNTLPEITSSDTSIYVKTYHQAFQVFVGKECIYTYGTDISVTFGNSVASAIHIIPIEQKYSGQKITLYLTSAYKKDGKLVPEVIIGSTQRILYKIFSDYGALIVETIAMLVIALTLILFWLSSRRAVYATNSFLYLGLSVFILTTWFATNSQVFGLFFGNVTVIMYLCYISFFLIPVPILLYFDETIGKGYKKFFAILEGISLGYFILAFILQFLNILNFKQLLPGVHIILVCMLMLLIFVALRRKQAGLLRSYRVHTIYCVCFCVLMMLIDLARYYLYYGNDVASFTRLGLIVYVLGLIVGMIQDSFDSIALANEATIYEKLAFSDKLTGLFNRTAYENAVKDLDEEISNQIYIQGGIVVVCFDLNNLKKINDTQGHTQGDAYIKAFANILLNVFRDKGNVYRTGGDEFVTILRDMTVDDAQLLVDKMNAEIGAYNVDFQAQWQGVMLSTAYGISDYRPTYDTSLQDVIERGDQNMYTNKIRMKLAMGITDPNARI